MARKLGRPPVKGEVRKYPFTISLGADEIALIDAIAQEARLTKSQLVRNLVRCGLDDARILKKLGIIKAVGIARDIVDRSRSQLDLPLVAE